MARPRLQVGEVGSVRFETMADGRIRARCSVRTLNGKLVSVETRADSREAARKAVFQRAKERTDDTGLGITKKSTIRELVDEWWETVEKRQEAGDISESTVANYRRTVDMIVHEETGVPGLQLQEVTPHRLGAFIKKRAGGFPSVARDLRRQFKFMFAYAIEHDAMRTNPASVGTSGERKKRKTKPRAATLDDLNVLRAAIRDFESSGGASKPRAAEKGVGGRPRDKYLGDLVDVFLGTGARIGEVLAIRWADMDLASTPATVTISGTIKRRPGHKKDGGGLYRQEWPKTRAGWRVVHLPEFATNTLLRLSIEDKGSPMDLVFHTSKGTPRDPSNVRTRLRAVRGEDLKWLTPHTFRRTVATLVEQEAGLRAASMELGHSEESVTARAYVDRARVAPDLSGVLEAFAGELVEPNNGGLLGA